MNLAQFIVRLAADDGTVLSWLSVEAMPRPQPGRASCPLWPSTPTEFVIDMAGIATQLQIHWVDLDVARTRPIDPVEVSVGQTYRFTWIEPMWLVSGMSGVRLGPITRHHSVAIAVPAGGIGLKTTP